jgi:hypothetical protein
MSESGSHIPRKPPESLGVMFDCCNVYRRVFKRADGTAYEGRCPKCGHPVRLVVGAEGSSSRVWRTGHER